MANNPDYRCSRCHKDCQRDLLTVKKVVFLEMGMGGRTIKSRVAGWLCPDCTGHDEDWNREKFVPPAQLPKASMEAVSG